MVSAPTIEAAPRFAQILHQCENLKASIHGKSLEVTSILMDEFVFRQNLENLYKSILLSDVQFALDNKIELELWNNAFKEHIDSFRYIIKERKSNNEKGEVQAKLYMFLDASIGFYFQLLQEFCDKYDLDLPYHGKARQLGILTKPKKGTTEKKTKLDSCLYICQDCLVHLGDLARYRNEIQQAHAFYLLAAKILPGNGQPYNQLAILASAKNDLLYSVFYYCKSISVPNPFPAAASNLQKTFSQASAKYSCNVLGKSSGLNVDEFLGLFINLSGSTYLTQDFSKLNVLRSKVLQDFNKILMDLKPHQLISITGICIFNLQKSRYKNMFESVSDDETNVWQFMLSFYVSILQLFLQNTIECLRNANVSSDDLKCLPGIKMFSDWILCNTIGLDASEHFQGNAELFNYYAVLGNELQKVCKHRDKSLFPLMEDWELHGMSALQKVHRRYDFRIQPLDISKEKLCNIRVTRILRFLDCLTKQVQTAKLITKRETDNVCEYVCLIPLNQGGRCKSPFSEKSMSLFRTDSEECGMNDIPSVQGPVASYSLFDTMWKSTLQQTPSESGSLITTSSPLLPLKGVTILESSISSCLSDLHEQNGLIGTPIPAKPHIGIKQQHSQKSSPTFEEMSVKHNNLQKKPQYSKIVSSSNGDTVLFSNTVAGSPRQLQPASPLQLQSSVAPALLAHLPEQQNTLKGIPHSSTEDISSNSIANLSHHTLSVQNQRLRSQPFQNQAMKIHQQVNQQQQRHQEILLAGNLFLAKQLESNRLPENQFHAALIPTAVLDPNQPAPTQFATHSPNFGVIGQSVRVAPGMPRSPLVPSQFGPLPRGATNILPANTHHPWVSPNQRLPTNMIVENRSIWSSNYAIGQGELSPLEQLLQEQRRHQRPK